MEPLKSHVVSAVSINTCEPSRQASGQRPAWRSPSADGTAPAQKMRFVNAQVGLITQIWTSPQLSGVKYSQPDHMPRCLRAAAEWRGPGRLRLPKGGMLSLDLVDKTGSPL